MGLLTGVMERCIIGGLFNFWGGDMGRREPLKACERCEVETEEQARWYKTVLEFARTAFNGTYPDAVTYVNVGYDAEEEFPRASWDTIHLAVSQARRELGEELEEELLID